MTQGTVHDIKNTFEVEFSTEYLVGEIAIEHHFHKNTEMIAVEQGELKITVNEKEYTAKAGEAVIILPFRIHSAVTDNNAKIRRITIGENLGLAFLNAMPTANPVTPIFKPSKDAMAFYNTFLSHSFGDEYIELSRINPPSKRILAKSIVYTLGSEFIDSTEFISDASNDDFTNIIEKMTKYISDNYTDNISRATMAEEFGYNPQYLSRKIKNTLGINFKKMLNQHRINHAFRLIQDTNKPYSEIAFESGFQSIRSFNQVCVETYGKRPSQLREEYARYNKTFK